MSLYQLLFSFRGRVSRRVYWVWNIAYYVLVILSAAFVGGVFVSHAYWILPVLLVVLMVPDFAITTKRWHDRDKSAAWLALQLPVIFVRMVSSVNLTQGAQSGAILDNAILIVALVCALWTFVECGFLAGSKGENRFGAKQSTFLH